MSRITVLLERFAMQVLLATRTVTGELSILRTKWDQTWSVLERAAVRSNVRLESPALPRLGIDEGAFLTRKSYTFRSTIRTSARSTLSRQT
ncbi:MAG: ISL3 family transposase, partial [Planctomyces sp.]